MAGIPLHAVLQHLRRLHDASDAASRSDRELLRAFAVNNDQDAFAVVVTRHAPLVWGVCRRILGHQQDAEDAFQATFLILARRASSTRWQSSVGGWLYTVAHRLAVRARQRAERRRTCEREASRTPPAESSLRELAIVVDEELRRLPAKYRDPLLLHYLEGVTAEAAARQLGLSRGTFYNRLTHGRELLRGRLNRQGLSLAAPLLATALTHEAEAAAPSLIQAALRGATESVPQRVAVLAAEALRNTLLAKLKIGLALGLLFGVAAGGVAMLTPQAPLSPTPQAERPADPPKIEDKTARRVDRYGDPLPEGAIVRLGTLRFRVDAFQVEHLAYSPDGKTLAVSSSKVASSNRLCLIDAATGKQTKSIPPPSRSTSFGGGVFSADGKRLMTAATVQMPDSRKTLLQIWDVASGRKVSESEVELANVLWWGCTSEGQPLVACLGKGAICLHEIATGRKRHFLAKDLPDPTSGFPCWCTVGKKLLVASNDKGVVHLWDITSGEERCTLQTRDALVYNPILSPDERWLASLSRDAAGKMTVQLWEATTGKATHTVAADQKYLNSVAFAPDSKTLATVGELGVRFWDAASGRERDRIKGEGRSFAASVSFSPNGKTLATAERYGGAVHLWDVATGERKPQPEGHSTYWPAMPSFSPDGERVATSGGIDGTIRVWDVATGRPLARIRRSPQRAAACAFSADGRMLLSCWHDKLLLSDVATGRELHVLKSDDPNRPKTRQQGGVGMYLSADRRKVIAFSQSMEITGWDMTTRKQLFRRQLAWHGNLGIAVSANTDLLALSDAQRGGREPIHVEDLKTGERLLTFPTFQGQTWPLTFSPDGRLLISYTSGSAPTPGAGGGSQMLRVSEVLTASELLALPTIESNAKAAFSPDGRLLAATALSGEILLWDLRRGKELHSFKGYNSSVTALAFSPDGRRLVSGLSDSTLLVWDVAAVRSKDRPAALDAASGRRAWDDLAADARKAFAARWTLAAAPDQAMPLLRERLQPAQPADRERVRKLLADLDSEQFTVREKARRELTELGDLAEPALRKALADKPSLEARRQIETLLDKLRAPVTRPETLRALRAVAVLEDIDTTEARRILERLARGTAEARLTREAKASLRRLDLRFTPSR